MKICEHFPPGIRLAQDLIPVKKPASCQHCGSSQRLLRNLNDDKPKVSCLCYKHKEGIYFNPFAYQLICFSCDKVTALEKSHLQINFPLPNRVLGCTGLANLGNTCFINVILQVLSNLVCVYKLLTNYVFPVSTSLGSSNISLISELCKVLHSLWQGHSTISPVDFIRCTDKEFSILNRHDHQDSSEFFKLLYDHLEESLSKHLKTDFLRDCFMWKIKTEITCKACKSSKNSNEEFIELPLSIPKKEKIAELRQMSLKSLSNRDQEQITNVRKGIFNKFKLLWNSKTTAVVSVYDCLHEYFKDEEMNDSKNLILCEKCGCGTESVKSQKIETLPAVLTLQFKRYLTSFKKYPIHVQLPNELDLGEFMDGCSKRYLLTCIVIHKGDMNSGHYVAYCKNRRDSKWYKFDDRGVHVRSEEQILAQQVYLAFYTQEYMKKHKKTVSEYFVPLEWSIKFRYMNNYGKSNIDKLLCKHGKININFSEKHFTEAFDEMIRPGSENFPLVERKNAVICEECLEIQRKKENDIKTEKFLINSAVDDETGFFIDRDWWQSWILFITNMGPMPGPIVNKNLEENILKPNKKPVEIGIKVWAMLLFLYNSDYEFRFFPEKNLIEVNEEITQERFQKLDDIAKRKLTTLKQNKLNMRPTNLGFRSPKERTAEYSNPNVTYDGRLLPFIQPKHSTMPLSKRFMQYEVAARRTAGRVGPGSYNIRKGSIDQNDVPGTPVIRPYHALKNLTSNGYFFIGDQVVYDPSFDKKERKSSQPSMEIKTSRFSSASNHRDTSVRHQDSLEKMKNSPYLAHRKKNQELST